MAKGIRICKICGEPYEYCHSNVPAGTNRWQDVACCVEHATQYFKEIAISRGELVEEESDVKSEVIEEEVEEKIDEDVDDELDEEEFEDEDEDEDDSEKPEFAWS